MQLTEQDIGKFISIGKTGSQLEKSSLEYFTSREYLNYQDPNAWQEFASRLSDEEIIFTYKALIILEKELGWGGISVASALWVYKIIQNRGLDNNFQIADFALRNSNNPYVPFHISNRGARTIEEYFRYQSEWEEAKVIRRKEIEKTLTRLKGRKKKRAAQIAELRNLSYDDRGSIKIKLLEKYNGATVLEKLNLIAEDQVYPPEYYPSEWVKIPMEQIEALPIKLIKKLYDKLSTKTKGEWKQFARKLEKLDDGEY